MAFSLATLATFNLEDSGILIQKAVLGADLMQYLDVRPGYPEATVSVNVLGLTAGFEDASCGWTSAGSTNFTQIAITNATKSWKQSLCLEDLRQYWLSTQLDASAYGEKLPFEQVIADQMLICQDIIAQLRSDKWDFTLGQNVSIAFFTERLSDLVAGVQAQISLALPYVADRCAVPSSYPLPDGVE
jgi:hypothetical protein